MREYLINQLKKEIVGPGLEPNEQSPYKDDITGEEILLNYVHGAPIQRYGAGILFPQEITDEIQNDNLGFEENENEGNILITDDDDDSQPKRIVSKETNEAI